MWTKTISVVTQKLGKKSQGRLQIQMFGDLEVIRVLEANIMTLRRRTQILVQTLNTQYISSICRCVGWKVLTFKSKMMRKRCGVQITHSNNLWASFNDGSQSHTLLRHAIMESPAHPSLLCLQRTLFVQERCQNSKDIKRSYTHMGLGKL